MVTQSAYQNTYIEEFDLNILQPCDGYRFSVDSLLLVDFVTLRPGSKVLDIGTGCGIISLCLARKFDEVSVIGIEIQAALYDLAKENVLRNDLGHKVRIIKGDIRDAGELFSPGEFDVVVTNPPYRPPDTGRLCPNAQEALSRHEILLDLNILLNRVRYVLRAGGRFFIVYPSDRAATLIGGSTQARLEPKAIQFIHPKQGREARMFLMEAVKDARLGGLRVRPPLYVSGHRYGAAIGR